MLDGPLQMKIPEAAVAREQITRDVMSAMRSLLMARSAPARPARSNKTSKAPRRRTS